MELVRNISKAVRAAGLTLALCLGGPGLALAQATLDLRDGTEDLEEDLRGASLLLAEVPEGETRTAQDLIAAARADYTRLVAALYENGYFAPVVSILVNGQEAATLSPFAAPPQIRSITIRVEPGQPFVLGVAEVSPLAPGTELPEEFRPGGPATTPVLRRTTEAAISGWRDSGHATAEVAEQSIIARHSQALLDARIRLDPGPLVTFGELLPEGEERMRPERIREIAGLPTGEVFDPDALDRAADRLRRTNVFRSVALQETPPGPNDVMDIEALVTEAPLRRFGFGAEVSSVDGATLSSYWLHRNLLGGAERLRFDAQASGIGGDSGGIDWELSTVFSRPATFTPDTTLVFDARIALLDEDLYEETLFEASAGVEHIFSETLSGALAVGLRYSDVKDALGEREVTLLTLPGRLTFDNRDDPLDARDGYFAEVETTPFAAVGGEGGGGIRATLDARTYLAFGQDDRHRIAARLQLGTLEGAEITDLPPNFLFYSGGGDTVRGQEFQSLGATQAGQPSGGRGFAGLSTEFRTDITDTYGLVAFADTGYVSAGPLGDTDGDWHAGVGLGFRYNTALGPIRVDVATPATGDNAGRRVFLYIGIGHTF